MFIVPPVIERYPKTLLHVVFSIPDPVVTFPVFPSEESMYDAPNWIVRNSLLRKLLQAPPIISDMPPPLIVPVTCRCCATAVLLLILDDDDVVLLKKKLPKTNGYRLVITTAITMIQYNVIFPKSRYQPDIV
jgi:hypothetical protein